MLENLLFKLCTDFNSMAAVQKVMNWKDQNNKQLNQEGPGVTQLSSYSQLMQIEHRVTLQRQVTSKQARISAKCFSAWFVFVNSWMFSSLKVSFPFILRTNDAHIHTERHIECYLWGTIRKSNKEKSQVDTKMTSTMISWWIYWWNHIL